MHKLALRGIAATFSVALLGSSSAMAYGVVATTSAFAPDPLGDNNVSDLDHLQAFSGTVHVSSEASGFGALAVAEASTEFGINRAFAQATSPDLNQRFPPLAAAFASSLWSDDLTINTTASGGFLEVGFQFHAFTIQSSYDYPSPVLTYEVQLLDLFSGNQITQYRLTMDGSGNTVSYLPGYTDGFELDGDNVGDVLRIVGVKIPFTANRPFGIASTLGCETRAPYDDANIQTCNANGTSLWGGITAVTDADGNAVTDWNVRSGSGTDYTKSLIPPVIAVVPEPPSWAMLALGMFAVGFFLRRRGIADRLTLVP